MRRSAKPHTEFGRCRRAAGRLVRDDAGAALVEFAIILPMMLVVFAVIIEGSRLMLSYHGAIAGVRDATRFLARVVPGTICATGGSVAGYAGQLQTIVGASVGGSPVLPSGVTVNSVTPSHTCVTGTYRINPTPVATVTASITVTFPFSGLFTLVGATAPTLTRTVTDRARIFGT